MVYKTSSGECKYIFMQMNLITIYKTDTTELKNRSMIRVIILYISYF